MITIVSRAWIAGLLAVAACASAEQVIASEAGDGADTGGSSAADAPAPSSDVARADASPDVSVPLATPSDDAGPRATGTTEDADSVVDVSARSDALPSGDAGGALASEVSPPVDGSALRDGAPGSDVPGDDATRDEPVDGPAFSDTTARPGDASAGALVVAYRSSSAAQVQFDLTVTNVGAESPLTSAVVVRYYLKVERPPGPADVFIDSASFTATVAPYYIDLKPSCAARFVPIAPAGDAGVVAASPDASMTPGGEPPDGYLELTCASSQPLFPGGVLNLQVRWVGSIATNDYSYEPSSAFVPNPRIVVRVGDTVVAGAPP